MQVKVWYDHKRECYVSNAGFALAKSAAIPANVAATLLAKWVMAHCEDVEKAWVS